MLNATKRINRISTEPYRRLGKYKNRKKLVLTLFPYNFEIVGTILYTDFILFLFNIKCDGKFYESTWLGHSTQKFGQTLF